ncbi:MAG TPA: hypothetical protein DIT47_05965 [Flavobacteriaceae bacterium]|nr:hypothetical protein [Flavobacteriaceae bacterium]
MNPLFVFFIFFFHFFWADLAFLHGGSNLRFFGMLIFAPLIYLFMKYVKIKNPYPNEVKFNWLRSIIVTLTMPFLIFLIAVFIRRLRMSF